MTDDKNRRKLKNLVIDSSAQIRFSIPFFILLITSAGIIILMHWQVTRALWDVGDSLTIQDMAIAAKISQRTANVFAIALSGLLCLGTMGIGLWLLYSHRIFGPIVPIYRQIENLCNGRYDEKIHLRKHDELTEIADALNKLADILNKSAKKSGTSL